MLTSDERIIVQTLVAHLDYMVHYAEQHESQRLAKVLGESVAKGRKLLEDTR